MPRWRRYGGRGQRHLNQIAISKQRSSGDVFFTCGGVIPGNPIRARAFGYYSQILTVRREGHAGVVNVRDTEALEPGFKLPDMAAAIEKHGVVR